MEDSRQIQQLQIESIQQTTIRKKQIENNNQLWKKFDEKAQKNGSHSAIYWVKKQSKNEDGTNKLEKWVTDNKYIGDWKNNKKYGFGIQHYGNGDKYEGGWENNARNGQGTYWICEGKNKLRREYTGDWQNDKRTGRGTMFYKNGDRYDGLWLDDKPHGEGRMIYANGDVYEGMWFMGKRSGYGVLTKRNGDHFEGHWVNDFREGQGSYFFSSKNQVFVGEWVNDMPKTGVYSEVEDPYTVRQDREKHFTEPYILPAIPNIKLKNPTDVLQEAMENVRKERTIFRAQYIPLDELYTKEELKQLLKEFSAAVNEKNTITIVDLQAILVNMSFELAEEDIDNFMKKIKIDYNKYEIEFDSFARLVAIILEQAQQEEELNDNFQDDKIDRDQEIINELVENKEQEQYGQESQKQFSGEKRQQSLTKSEQSNQQIESSPQQQIVQQEEEEEEEEEEEGNNNDNEDNQEQQDEEDIQNQQDMADQDQEEEENN